MGKGRRKMRGRIQLGDTFCLLMESRFWGNPEGIFFLKRERMEKKISKSLGIYGADVVALEVKCLPCLC